MMLTKMTYFHAYIELVWHLFSIMLYPKHASWAHSSFLIGCFIFTRTTKKQASRNGAMLVERYLFSVADEPLYCCARMSAAVQIANERNNKWTWTNEPTLHLRQMSRSTADPQMTGIAAN